MNITKNVTVYKCDFCKKKLFREKAMQYHELICFHNPENKRPCFGCQHLIKKEVTLYFDRWDGEAKRKVEVLYCQAKSVALIAPKTEIKGNSFDFGDEPSDLMPKDCKDFERITYPF